MEISVEKQPDSRWVTVQVPLVSELQPRHDADVSRALPTLESIPPAEWEATPRSVQALVLALLKALDRQHPQSDALESKVTALESMVTTLEEKLRTNSSNSSKPPSSDPPGTLKRDPKEPPTRGKKRKKGAQPGHPGHHRALIPIDQLDALVPC